MALRISENAKRGFDIVISLIGVIGAAVGAFITVHEYFDAKHKDRIANTLEYVRQYQIGSLQVDVDTVRNAMVRIDIEEDMKTNKNNEHSTNISEPDQPNMAMLEIYRQIKLENAVDHLVSFFDALATCATANPPVCDEYYARVTLGDEAKQFLGFSHSYICSEHQYWKEKEFRPSVIFFHGKTDCEANADHFRNQILMQRI